MRPDTTGPAAEPKIEVHQKPSGRWLILRGSMLYSTEIGLWCSYEHDDSDFALEADARAIAADLERRERGEGKP